ncbi:MAG: PspC domain-containing protein [Bacteroidetes bacterium]|nr:PspC domain-containing protein [Bacteroidota bacterium]
MKKTFTINISGIIFHIDEDAYELLGQYLDKLKRHFGNTEGAGEIISDIEGRIAELLQQKIDSTKQVITLEDVKELIGLMGQPNEMDDEQSDGHAEFSANQTSKPKRMFRDTENRKIGGVAAGLAAYLSIDVIWIRLLFVFLIFVTGSGLVIYLALWIALPEALTTYEKLQMKGEPANIANIQKTVKEEFNAVKGTVNEYANEARDTIKRTGRNGKTAFDSLLEVLGTLLKFALRGLGMLIGLVLLLMGLTFLVSLGVLLAGWHSFSFLLQDSIINISPSAFLDLILVGSTASSMVLLLAVILLLSPLALIIYLGLKLLIGHRFTIPYFVITVFALGLSALLGLGVIAYDTVTDFRHTATQQLDTRRALVSEGKTLTISAFTDPRFGGKRNTIHLMADALHMVSDGDEKLLFNYPELQIRPLEETGVLVESIPIASGINDEEAVMRAEAIQYTLEVNDSVVTLPTFYSYDAKYKIRNQRVKLIINVAEGQKIYFDNGLNELFRNNPNGYWRRKPYAGKTWVMTKNGLRELDEHMKPVVEVSDN